jgi:hypothetical protein
MSEESGEHRQHHCDWRMPCRYKALIMRILGDLRVVLLGMASTTVLLSQADAREVIRYALAAIEVKWRTIGMNYLSEGCGIRSAGLNRFSRAISL